MDQSATDPKARSGFILGHQAAGDVDFYSFPAVANDKLSLACGSARSGSGLVDAKFEVFNATSTTALQSDTETATADAPATTAKSAITVIVSASASLVTDVMGIDGSLCWLD